MSSRSLHRQISIVLLISFCIVNVLVLISRNNHSDSKFSSPPSIFAFNEISDNENENPTEKNELDGCYHVFLDVGSNIGNTVRSFIFKYLISTNTAPLLIRMPS